ncbi:MAG TPA: hypothetical protein DCZ94_02355 [Lentisphaeria bacterium]|nr:MAG: hypothetical protein A2X48_16195 [Lentisphaerae bacterium GWF2_49_21]HBC85776.1 hypothetical protein [Lentisphaeria bacterium]
MKIKTCILTLFAMISIQLFSADETVPAADQKKPKTVVIKPTGEFKYKLIPLKSLDFTTVESICKPLLSEGGILTYEEKRGSILVGDAPEVIAKIVKILEDIDPDAVNIRIDIDFLNTGSGAGGGVNVEVGYGPGVKPNQIIINNGKVVHPKTYSVSASKKSDTTIRNNSQFITTKSGFPATLFVGQTIADPSWLNNYKFLPPTVVVTPASTVIIPTAPGFLMRDVGSKLMVLPKLRDDGLIDVEIYPEVSYIDGKGANQAVRVENIVTKLTVEEGQRISIGGVVSSNQNFYKNLFGPQFLAVDNKTNVLDMYLKATVMKPRAKKAADQPAANEGDVLKSPHQWR